MVDGKTITGSHDGLTYEPIAVPVDKIRLIFPQNTFTAEMIGDHVRLTINTDAAGIPSVMAKLKALQAVMAIDINKAQMIEQFGDDEPA